MLMHLVAKPPSIPTQWSAEAGQIYPQRKFVVGAGHVHAKEYPCAYIITLIKSHTIYNLYGYKEKCRPLRKRQTCVPLQLDQQNHGQKQLCRQAGSYKTERICMQEVDRSAKIIVGILYQTDCDCIESEENQ